MPISKARLAKGKMTYIFLDEIQNVAEFPKGCGQFLYLKDHIDLYHGLKRAYAFGRGSRH